ncbi:MAG TPA: glucose 1-dehydrogenase [Jatrophihabitantaceae bacterium]|nr:glucose 1-dehydrogenase [Jatrophihabitantaceae bacterium]
MTSHQKLRLAGRTAVVTGAAQGQGAAEARRFIAEGANVLLGDINYVAAKSLADELGDAARAVRLDVGSRADWDAAIAAVSDWAPVSILINNAGIHWKKNVVDEVAEEFDKMLHVNVTGALLGMQAVVEPMRRNGGGSIVNVCSVLGLLGGRDNVAYAASKWALRGLTKSAAIDLGADRIRVNAVHPGYIETPMLAEVSVNRPADFYDYLPIQHAGTTDNIADLMVFLASDDSTYITGADFAIDGGMTAASGPKMNMGF